MRKFKLLAVLAMVVLMASCTTFTIKPNLTPDEAGRASIDYYQRQVKVNMENMELFLKGNPQYIAKFEAEIAPLFKQINTEIGNFIQLGKAGTLNVESVEGKLGPILDQIIIKLYEVGAKKK